MLYFLAACCTEPDGCTDPDPVDSGDTGEAPDTGDSADTGDTAVAEGPTFADLGLRLGIPAYVRPDGVDWPLYVDGAAQTGGLMVVNPASGPGSASQEVYVTGIAEAQALGVYVIGYVSTAYGTRDPDEIETEARKYRDWYGVDGIFLDEVPNTCEAWPEWYGARTDAIEAMYGPEALVAYNPGTASCEAYLEDADILVVAESDLVQLRDYAAEPWMAAYAPERFWFLAHTAGGSAFGESLQNVVDQGIAWVYVTDDNLPNPWDRAPSYWTSEVAAVEAN